MAGIPTSTNITPTSLSWRLDVERCEGFVFCSSLCNRWLSSGSLADESTLSCSDGIKLDLQVEVDDIQLHSFQRSNLQSWQRAVTLQDGPNLTSGCYLRARV